MVTAMHPITNRKISSSSSTFFTKKGANKTVAKIANKPRKTILKPLSMDKLPGTNLYPLSQPLYYPRVFRAGLFVGVAQRAPFFPAINSGA
jgi:hypothetical protein